MCFAVETDKGKYMWSSDLKMVAYYPDIKTEGIQAQPAEEFSTAVCWIDNQILQNNECMDAFMGSL